MCNFSNYILSAKNDVFAVLDDRRIIRLVGAGGSSRFYLGGERDVRGFVKRG